MVTLGHCALDSGVGEGVYVKLADAHVLGERPNLGEELLLRRLNWGPSIGGIGGRDSFMSTPIEKQLLHKYTHREENTS